MGMDTIELTLRVRLPKRLYQQLNLFQQVRQTESLNETVGVILTEYFRLMSPQLTQKLVDFPELWAANIMLRQGVVLGQFQQSVFDLNQLIQQHESVSDSSQTTADLNPLVQSNSSEDNWAAVELSAAISEQGMTGSKLAQRLSSTASAMSRKRNQADFKQWTQDRDPYNIAWEYRVKTCRFHPVLPM